MEAADYPTASQSDRTSPPPILLYLQVSHTTNSRLFETLLSSKETNIAFDIPDWAGEPGELIKFGFVERGNHFESPGKHGVFRSALGF